MFIVLLLKKCRLRWNVLDTTLCDIKFVSTPVSSTNKTCSHVITEILLKVVLSTSALTPFHWKNSTSIDFHFAEASSAILCLRHNWTHLNKTVPIAPISIFSAKQYLVSYIHLMFVNERACPTFLENIYNIYIIYIYINIMGWSVGFILNYFLEFLPRSVV